MEEKEKLLRYIQELATRIQSLKARVERLKGSTLKTVSGNPATFDDAIPYIALKQLKVNIEPVQSGSGDPSPTNIRPISGWTEVNVRVHNDSVDNQYNIPLGQTVYGGVLDVVSGKLVVDRAMVDLGSLMWFFIDQGNNVYFAPYFFAIVEPLGIKYEGNFGLVTYSLLCSIYRIAERGRNFTDGAMCADGIIAEQKVTQIQIKDSHYTSASDLKTALTGEQLVYELATPITYQLTPTEVRTILGDNNIWADTGSVEVTYRAVA